ncbi:MAG TPA: hypothetical protein VF808_03720 [Ktedonobacterales bacterium]
MSAEKAGEMSIDAGHPSAVGAQPRCIACSQARRGHGVTVSVYYLARALAERGLRVLVADLTGRRARLQWLGAREPTRGLTLWSPHIPAPEHLREALARAREQAAGKVDVILLDADGSYLQAAGGAAAGIDYTLIFIEQGEMGMREADHLARLLDETPPPQGLVAAVLTRVPAEHIEDLPQRTPEYGLPILGELPADYLLAAGDEYSMTNEEPRAPHDTYMSAMARLARALIPIAGISATSHPSQRTGQ